MDVVIRRATEDDAPALARVGAELFEQTYADSIPADELAAHLAQDFSEARQLEEIRDPKVSSLMARARR